MENNFSPEIKESVPLPALLDLVIIDGRFVQCVQPDERGGADFLALDDRSKLIRISPQEWEQYTYTPPAKDMTMAGDLVGKGLLTDAQLGQIHWGPEENENPELKKIVTFFGTLTKKK